MSSNRLRDKAHILCVFFNLGYIVRVPQGKGEVIEGELVEKIE